MAEFVGGAALGAAFGVAFAVLHDTVKNVGSKVLMFKSVLKSLKSNLDLLAPVVGEISRLNIELGLPEEETKSLIEDMNKAVRLINTCSAIPWWNRISKAHHSKQLTKLDKAIVKFCQVHMPAQIKRDTLQILKDTSQISHILEDKSSHILGNTSQISQILGDMSSQILEDTSHISQILGNTSQILGDTSHISQILGNTSQISHILEDKSSQILGNTSQISGNTSQISQILQILEDTSQISHNLEDMSQTLQMVLEEIKAFREENNLKEKAQILITPSGQCGKTTTREIHGHDVLIKGYNLTNAEHDIKNEVRQQSAPDVLSENNALDHGSKHVLMEVEEEQVTANGFLITVAGGEHRPLTMQDEDYEECEDLIVIEEEEEEEEGFGLLSTEELNKRCGEFIRKMKEEIKFGAQQSIIV